MGAEDGIDTVETTVLNHLDGTAGEHFFPVLMNEDDSTCQFILYGMKSSGQSENNRRMTVVSAGMHDAGTNRTER